MRDDRPSRAVPWWEDDRLGIYETMFQSLDRKSEDGVPVMRHLFAVHADRLPENVDEIVQYCGGMTLLQVVTHRSIQCSRQEGDWLLKMAKFLVEEKGASADLALKNDGKTFRGLFDSGRQVNFSVLRYLVQRAGGDLSGSTLTSILRILSLPGVLDADADLPMDDQNFIKHLIEKYYNCTSMLDFGNDRDAGKIFLAVACKYSTAEIVRHLIEQRGADANGEFRSAYADPQYSQPYVPMDFAHNPDIVQCLLENGADPNGCGEPPVISLARAGDHESIWALVRYGIDLERTTWGHYEPAKTVLQYVKDEMIHFEEYAPPEYAILLRTDALLTAASMGTLNDCRTAAEAWTELQFDWDLEPADAVDVCDKHGQTLLMQLIAAGRLENAKYWSQMGADVNATSRHIGNVQRVGREETYLGYKTGDYGGGITAAGRVAIDGNLELLQQLVMEFPDLDLDQVDKVGMTVLHWACLKGHETMVNWLVKRKKMDVLQENGSGYHCFDLAWKGGHWNLLRWLVLNCVVGFA